MLLALPAVVQAQYYYTTNNGTITITRYTNSDSVVIIPSTINGLPVTRIGEVAFAVTALTSVTIPDSVVGIGMRAFLNCRNLTNVVIGNGVTYLGGSAFELCTRLTDVTMGNNVISIGAWAFSETALTSVTIPDSVTTIGDWAFYKCTNMTEATIGSSVTNIGDRAFHFCDSLTNVTIGNGVTSIGDGAFYATGLTTVTIPDSVTSIGDTAFYTCTRLMAINVDARNSVYSSVDGVLFNKSQTILLQYPGTGTKAGSYIIPDGVASIGNWAFSRCYGLTSVTAPSSVASIGNFAFGSCTNLTGVYFRGNAPVTAQPTFQFEAANKAIVYYLPGTAGWGPTFAGRPTAQWLLPHLQILTTGPGFGIQPNGFGFTISWATNNSVVVEASTNLVNPAWSPVGTNTLTGGSSYFNDPQWTNYPARFYRLRSP